MKSAAWWPKNPSPGYEVALEIMGVASIFRRLCLFVTLSSILVLLAACGGGGEDPAAQQPSPTPRATATPAPTATPLSTPSPQPTAAPEGIFPSEFVVTDTNFALALAFAPDGRLFYNELCTGDIRIITPDDDLLPQPFAHVEPAACGEWGLTGLALDPDFETNHYVYVHYTEEISSNPRVVKPVIRRFTEVDNVGTDPTVIMDDEPTTDPSHGKNHSAGNIHFGPDGFLYVNIGDMGHPDEAQDLSSLRGKILRIDKSDGSAPPDNPFVDTPGADPRIFAYGMRNSHDFTWNDKTGAMYAVENGPDRCDELNFIVPGGNYGWRIPYEPDSCDVPVGIQPMTWFTFFVTNEPWRSNVTAAPAGIVYIDGDIFPSLGDSLLVCQFKNGRMVHLQLGGPAQDEVTNGEGELKGFGEVILGDGCMVAIEISPMGEIYFSSRSAILRLLVDPVSEGPASP